LLRSGIGHIEPFHHKRTNFDFDKTPSQAAQLWVVLLYGNSRWKQALLQHFEFHPVVLFSVRHIGSVVIVAAIVCSVNDGIGTPTFVGAPRHQRAGTNTSQTLPAPISTKYFQPGQMQMMEVTFNACGKWTHDADPHAMYLVKVIHDSV
jgi:hypothetical protein